MLKMNSPKKANRLCELSTSDGHVSLSYDLRRPARLRHLRVVIDESDRVILKVPRWASERRAIEFLHSQGEWILETLRRRAEEPDLEDWFRRYDKVSAKGMRLRLAWHPSPTGKLFYEYDLRARSLNFYVCAGAPLQSQLIALIRAFAVEVLIERTRELARLRNVLIARVSVRDQRTRWGSCTDSGNISLNWRLVLLPTELQDYIIWHELAHIRELNHSRSFWKLLETYDPLAREHDRTITELSPLLMRLGRC